MTPLCLPCVTIGHRTFVSQLASFPADKEIWTFWLADAFAVISVNIPLILQSYMPSGGLGSWQRERK